LGNSTPQDVPWHKEGCASNGAPRRLLRVSSKGDRDPDRWLTVPHQRGAIERWCATNGHRLADVRQDIDVSGGSDRRPNLETLVTKVEAGALGGIVVAKLDRFGRNLPYGVQVIERIDAAGGLFVAAADGFDLRTDSGRLHCGHAAALFHAALGAVVIRAPSRPRQHGVPLDERARALLPHKTCRPTCGSGAEPGRAAVVSGVRRSGLLVA
jgi:hypothetical protein